MAEIEDWLQDPIQSRKLKSPDEKRNDLWQIFHFSTRLKLNAAEHFCRQMLGAASMSYDLGLPLLAFSQLKWYLDAFFFEIISAYDTLLQELNVVYDMGLKPKQVRWANRNTKESKFLSLLKAKSSKVFDYMEKEWGEKWFENVRQYRNMAAHHHYVPTSSVTTISGKKPWDYDKPQIYIWYLDNSGEVKEETISNCKTYLSSMVGHVHQVWEEMVQEFE